MYALDHISPIPKDVTADPHCTGFIHLDHIIQTCNYTWLAASQSTGFTQLTILVTS